MVLLGRIVVKTPRRIKWRHVSRLYEALAPTLKASPSVIKAPETGRVLVLSPHIDDDVIGAGGTLRKHILAGDLVKAVYFAGCTEERIREGRLASGVLGFQELVFFEYGPKKLQNHPEIIERLLDIFTNFNPDIVYLPSLFDRHNDHVAVNNFLSAVIPSIKGGFTVHAYEVWTAIVPNLVVDISDTLEAKKKALKEYRSQLSSNDWVDAAISLNRYRGVTSGAGTHAEAFMRYSMEEYSALWEKVYG